MKQNLALNTLMTLASIMDTRLPYDRPFREHKSAVPNVSNEAKESVIRKSASRREMRQKKLLARFNQRLNQQ